MDNDTDVSIAELKKDVEYLKAECNDLKTSVNGLDDSFKSATYWIIGILVAVVGTFGYFVIAKVMV